MKQFLQWPHGRPINHVLVCLVMAFGCFSSCRKSENGFRDEFRPSFFSSEVIDKWLTLEIRLFKNATGISNGSFARPFAYSGITAYESTNPGHASCKNIYNGLSILPELDRNKLYLRPSCVNLA